MDWAALAKQWMQFKDVGDSTNTTPPPPPSDNGKPPMPGEPKQMPWNGPVTNVENSTWGSSTTSDWTTDMDMEVIVSDVRLLLYAFK